MIKFTSCLLGLAVLVGSTATAQAATLTRIFAFRVDTITNDFLNVGPAPTNLLMIAGIDDGGTFSDLRVYDGAISNNLLVTTLNTGAATWSIGNNSPNDTFTFSGLENGTANLLTFVIENQPSSVNNTAATIANADRILRDPWTFGTPFSFVGLGGTGGYFGAVTAVPEPSSMALLLGCVAAGGMVRRRRR